MFDAAVPLRRQARDDNRSEPRATEWQLAAPGDHQAITSPRRSRRSLATSSGSILKRTTGLAVMKSDENGMHVRQDLQCPAASFADAPTRSSQLSPWSITSGWALNDEPRHYAQRRAARLRNENLCFPHTAANPALSPLKGIKPIAPCRLQVFIAGLSTKPHSLSRCNRSLEYVKKPLLAPFVLLKL